LTNFRRRKSWST